MPRHPRSAYLIWTSEQKERLSQEARGANIKFSRWASAQWKSIDKSVWESLAAAEKDDYAFEKSELPAKEKKTWKVSNAACRKSHGV